MDPVNDRQELPSLPAEGGSDEEKVEAFLKARSATICESAHAAEYDQEAVIGDSQPKKRKEWSPEARAAAAERMRAMRAGGVIKSRNKGGTQAEIAVTEQPFVEVSVDKLQTVHKGYAGKRDPDQELTDADWPDIQNMLEKMRRSVSQIASDYDVEFATMRQFIDRHLWNRKPAPGEVRAPTQ